MVQATTGPSYLDSVPSLPRTLLARPHEELTHRQRLREQRLLREIKVRIRQARAERETLFGPIDVEEGTQPDDL